ncbi:MAG: Eco57I restriction-modification methylase domain-containing protein, partial [Patescibacteria group bacterium]
MIVPKVKFVEGEKTKTIDLSGNIREINFKPIDAFVSNLPYIRDEDLNKVLGIKKEDEQEKIKNFLMKNNFPPHIPESGSDFHVYFWYYILPFLKEGSRVGFLTSDTWLNVEYGDSLKKFINKYFKIIAIIDSSVERWFEDALVNTVITILERTSNEEERKNNKIKFVRINKKISDLIHDLNDAIKIAQDIEKGISKKDVTITREIRQG